MRHIPLTQGKFAIVDDDDFERVMELEWHACRDPKNGRWYAKHTKYVAGPPKQWLTVQLHKFVLHLSGRQQVDHRNGDGLDNQKRNLRPCSPAGNQHNRSFKVHTSRFKGVDFNSVNRGKKWRAQIGLLGKRTYIGRFHTEEEAAAAYDAAALRHYGEFARTNQQMGVL